MNQLEQLEEDVRLIAFKLEALRWRIEAHSRDVAEIRERLRVDRARQQTAPFPLRKCPP